MSISSLVLISEFIIVDHGKYIVKVSAFRNNVILGTGLGGADTVEKAEDEARKRAIEVINWTSNLTPAATSQITNQNVSPSSPQNDQKVVPPLKTQSITAKKQINVTSFPASKIIEQPEISSSIKPPVTPQNDRQKTPELNIFSEVEARENKVEKTIPSSIPPAESSSISETDTTPIETNNDGDNLPLIPETKPSESNNAQPELDFTSGSQEVKPVDKKTTNSVRSTGNNSPTASSTETIETMDFSQIINQTTIELKRLRWTQEDGKKHLLATYGKKSRHLLSDEELIEFLNYLQQQP